MTTLIIAQLTIHESQRRRILWVALIMGFAFLAIFGIGFHYIVREFTAQNLRQEDVDIVSGLMLSAGLYATNLLVTIMTVLVSVTAISGEIDSHTIETLITKPVRRWEIVFGKWLAFAGLAFAYILLLAGSLILIVYLRAGYLLDNVAAGLALMVLQTLIILSVTIAGGTRLSTLANGVLAFMLYGIAFLGGWVEQIGALLRNETAVDVGIITSLIMPTEIIWKKALSLFQPEFTSSPIVGGPFAVTSQPSNLMIAYGALYMLSMMSFAMWSFSRRDL